MGSIVATGTTSAGDLARGRDMERYRIHPFRPPQRGEHLGEGFGKCRLCGGRLWPESLLVKDGGGLYCQEHYAAKFLREAEDDAWFDFRDTGGDVRRTPTATPTATLTARYGSFLYGSRLYGAGL